MSYTPRRRLSGDEIGDREVSGATSSSQYAWRSQAPRTSATCEWQAWPHRPKSQCPPRPTPATASVPVVGYITPDPAVYTALAPVNEYVASAPVNEYVASAPVNEYVASARVIEYVAPAPVTTLLEPPVPVLSTLCWFLRCRSCKTQSRLHSCRSWRKLLSFQQPVLLKVPHTSVRWGTAPVSPMKPAEIIDVAELEPHSLPNLVLRCVRRHPRSMRFLW